jgi:hypothetical protein
VLDMSNECGMKECDRQTKRDAFETGRSLGDTVGTSSQVGRYCG